MYERVEKPKENKSRAVANSVTQRKSNLKQGFGIVDNRPEATVQRKIQKKMENRSGAVQLRSVQQMLDNPFTTTQRKVSQLQLAPNTYVRVYEQGSEYYGKILAVNKTTYDVEVGGTGTETERGTVNTVPKSHVALHTALVAAGRGPEGVKEQQVDVSKSQWAYHVTSGTNLISILEQRGLVPKSRITKSDFAGLDAARGAVEKKEDIPKRIEGLMETLAELPEEYQDLAKKMLYDALLGGKEEFIYATRDPRVIFGYADRIREAGKQKSVVFRFAPQGRVWYKDIEDPSAEKSMSSIPLSELYVARFFGQKADVGKVEAEEKMSSLTWNICSNESEMFKMLEWVATK